MQQNQFRSVTAKIRLAELIAALSLATDLGMGQPMEYALCVCVLSVRLGEVLVLDEDELHNVYYLALLRHIGCNAETDRMADLYGELALRADIASIDSGNTSQVVDLVMRYIRQANQGSSPQHLALMIEQGLLATPPLMKEAFTGFCEVAQRLAERLGFDESIKLTLGQVFERWDGQGIPGVVKGEDISLPMRIVTLAQDAITFHRLRGVEAVVKMARERKGTLYDPHIVDCFCQQASQLLMGLDEEPPWEVVIALEPGLCASLSVEQFVAAFHAGYPDIHTTIEDMIAEDDKVVWRYTVRGTHKGEFMGIAPTNRPVTLTGILISRFVDDKIVEDWNNYDALGMLQQLGVIP